MEDHTKHNIEPFTIEFELKRFSEPLPLEHTDARELPNPSPSESPSPSSDGSGSSSSTSRTSTTSSDATPSNEQYCAPVAQGQDQETDQIVRTAEGGSHQSDEDNNAVTRNEPLPVNEGTCGTVEAQLSGNSSKECEALQENPILVTEGENTSLEGKSSLALSNVLESQADILPAFLPAEDHPGPKSDEGGKYPCLFPGCSNTAGFSRQADLKRHFTIHTGNEPWRCGCCENAGRSKPYQGKRKDNLVQHLRKTHQASIYHECTLCPRSSEFGAFYSGPGCVEVHRQLQHKVPANNESLLRIQKGHVMLSNGDHTSTSPEQFDGCADCKAFVLQHVSSENPSITGSHFLLDLPEPVKQAKRFDSQSCTARAQQASPTRRRHVWTSTERQDSSEELASPQPDALSLGRDYTPSLPSGPQQHDRQVFTHWICGDCPADGVMDLRLHEYCVHCGRRRSQCARYVGLGKATPVPVPDLETTNGVSEAPEAISRTPESILDVPLASFLMMIDALKEIEAEVVATFQEGLRTGATPTGKIAVVSYDNRHNSIKFSGPAPARRKAKSRVQAVLESFAARPGSWILKNCSPRPVLAISRLPNFRTKQTKPSFDVSRKFFSLRVRHDAALIRTWEDTVLPALSGLLKGKVGPNYTASFMREGRLEAEAKACIRIVVFRRCSKKIRDNIRQAIQDLFAYPGVKVPVHFSEGKLRLLMGGIAGLLDESEENVDLSSLGDFSDAEEDNDTYEFRYHQQYWHKPGPGASIGLLNTRRVSATLGGLVHVKKDSNAQGELYALTVNHVIEASRAQADRAGSDESDKSKITSPSLHDVYANKNDLQQLLRDLREEISQCPDAFHKCRTTDEWQRTAKEGDLNKLVARYHHVSGLLAEVEKNDWDYELGTVSHQCPSKLRTSLGSQFTIGAPGLPGRSGAPIRMDWAICLVNSDRAGKNRLRFKYDSDNNVMIDAPMANSTGAGSLIQETEDLEPEALVHYVGRKSGKRQGKISATRMAVDWDGTHTNEWVFICSNGEAPDAPACEGDSGAWIIRDWDNKVCGQLYGWQKGMLVISPINDIIADIKQLLGTPHVSLPRYRQFSQPADPLGTGGDFRSICEVEDRPTKPRRIKISSLPPLASRRVETDGAAIVPRMPAVLGRAVTPHQECALSPCQALANERARPSTPPSSPAPSLVSASSASSKPSSAQRSPSVREDPPTPRQLPSPMVSTIGPAIGDDTGAAGRQTMFSLGLHQDPSVDAASDERIDKTSLSFILNTPAPSIISGLQNSKIAGLAGPRYKSATFPLQKNLAESRTYSWDDGASRLTKHMVANAHV